jgi:hypothetical protein
MCTRPGREHGGVDVQGKDIASLKALRCPKCLAFLRPDVVLFTESLPADVWRRASRVALPQSLSLSRSLSLSLSFFLCLYSTVSLHCPPRIEVTALTARERERESARARARERERALFGKFPNRFPRPLDFESEPLDFESETQACASLGENDCLLIVGTSGILVSLFHDESSPDVV